ncbi:hypothetical protein HQN90_05965 [Paenibacillus alba]|uniref:hypothetical protein n=1 Tax=Paenibacillus alba TaxID=1197127 RepID=UPI001564FC23|nr:hypothetical protein [Paenibacillus alba]NQX65669.1 hypothetical protein [Paenibacillus alba]
MNDLRKRAYKTLNFQAFLDIKNGGTFCEENFKRTFRIAHAFHNLAEYIILDLQGFDESEFWERIGVLEEQLGLYHYRKAFNEIINQ